MKHNPEDPKVARRFRLKLRRRMARDEKRILRSRYFAPDGTESDEPIPYPACEQFPSDAALAAREENRQ